MAAKKDKMIPSEKERKRALKYATPAGTGRMWVTMGIAFIIFGTKSKCQTSWRAASVPSCIFDN